MKKHIFIDCLTQSIASILIGKKRFFSNSTDSLAIRDILDKIEIEPTPIETGQHEIKASTPHGVIDPAYYVFQMKGKDFPTIIYHHGNNERPFDFRKYSKNSFKEIFLKKVHSIDANIIILRAPFHNSSLRDYQEKIGRMANFTAMLATSTVLVESITNQLKNESFNQPVIISGISLGGWITNLHRTYFNTADIYIPMLAGAALDELFISSAYRKMTSKTCRKNPEKITSTLNFEEEFRKVSDNNVFPILGKYDQYIRYDRQKKSYHDSTTIHTLNKGHVTTLLEAPEQLLNHILTVMNLKNASL